MDIVEKIWTSEITFWVLAFADVFGLCFLLWVIFLFRNDVCKFEKEYRNQFKKGKK